VRAVRYVESAKLAGAYVECGVYKGASIVAMIRTLQSLDRSNRDIWLYDTFEGMPKPEAIDKFYAASGDCDWGLGTWNALKRDDGSGGSNWVWGPLDEVKAYVGKTGYPPSRLHYIKGMVEETIPGSAPEKISILRLDTDFYSSTKHEFVHLYPRMVPGGVVIIDDYGAYAGSRKATDEYFQEKGMHVLLSRVDEHVRMFVKP
jgi:O-methyltransferase